MSVKGGPLRDSGLEGAMIAEPEDTSAPTMNSETETQLFLNSSLLSLGSTTVSDSRKNYQICPEPGTIFIGVTAISLAWINLKVERLDRAYCRLSFPLFLHFCNFSRIAALNTRLLQDAHFPDSVGMMGWVLLVVNTYKIWEMFTDMSFVFIIVS